MKILLVAPYKSSFLGLAKFPPLGLGYLATALRKNRYEVKILDCLKEGLDRFGYREYISKEKPGVLGVNSWSCSVNEVKEILGITKEIDARIITVVGGPHPSAAPSEAMDFFQHADFGFRGEAEIGLPMLVDMLLDKRKIDLNEIPGLIWKKNGCWNANRQVLYEALDDFDYPAWDLIKPQEYSQAGTVNLAKTAPIITSRGCPYYCTFCSASIIAGRKIRLRSIENIIKEIRLLKEAYGMKSITIMDENFTFNKNHALLFCNRIIKEKLDMDFFLPQGARLDALDEKLLLLMKKARFSPHIALGIESGSERVLKMIKKNVNKEMVKDKVNLLRRLGFRPVGYFILGFPTETKEEMYKTLAFAKELKLYRAAFSPLLLLPATEIYETLKNSGEIPADYSFSSLITDKIAYAPSGMTLQEFSRIRKDIILKFNLQIRVILDYICDRNSFIFAIKKIIGIFFRR
jgi:radical SAM superfamily enzyme YgiQ (UPF0313 family)